MEFIKENARAIVIALLAVGVITVVSSSASTVDEPATTEETSEQSSDEDRENFVELNDNQADDPSESSAFNDDGDREPAEVTVGEDSYSVTVRNGDNQTTLVRDVIAQHMDADKDFSLTAEQMVYLETNLVDSIERNDLIFAGDAIEVSSSIVEQFVESAQDLTQAELDCWAMYT